jgi:hypothetical protein
MLQAADFARVGDALDLYQVGLRMLIARVGQLVSQLAVIGQQQQPFAVLVQPTDGKEALGHLNQLETRRVFGARVLARKVAGRFVQHDIAVTFRDDRPTVHADVGPDRVGLGPQLSHDATVHRHPAGRNQFFARPARTKARLGEDLLQTLFHYGPSHTASGTLANT